MDDNDWPEPAPFTWKGVLLATITIILAAVAIHISLPQIQKKPTQVFIPRVQMFGTDSWCQIAMFHYDGHRWYCTE